MNGLNSIIVIILSWQNGGVVGHASVRHNSNNQKTAAKLSQREFQLYFSVELCVLNNKKLKKEQYNIVHCRNFNSVVEIHIEFIRLLNN